MEKEGTEERAEGGGRGVEGVGREEAGWVGKIGEEGSGGCGGV